MEALTEAYGDLVTEPVPYSPRVRESLAARQPLAQYDPRSPGALAYAALAQRLGGMATHG